MSRQNTQTIEEAVKTPAFRMYLGNRKPKDMKGIKTVTLTIVKCKDLMIKITGTVYDKDYNVAQEEDIWVPIASDARQEPVTIETSGFYMFLGEPTGNPQPNPKKETQTVTIVKYTDKTISLCATAYDKDLNVIEEENEWA